MQKITSMRKAGEWRTLQIGSPKRSVKRESSPLGPTSHLLSTSSTLLLSFSRSNFLTITTTLPLHPPPPPPPPPPPTPISPILSSKHPQTRIRVRASTRGGSSFIDGEGSAEEGLIAAFSRPL